MEITQKRKSSNQHRCASFMKFYAICNSLGKKIHHSSFSLSVSVVIIISFSWWGWREKPVFFQVKSQVINDRAKFFSVFSPVGCKAGGWVKKRDWTWWWKLKEGGWEEKKVEKGLKSNNDRPSFVHSEKKKMQNHLIREPKWKEMVRNDRNLESERKAHVSCFHPPPHLSHSLTLGRNARSE